MQKRTHFLPYGCQQITEQDKQMVLQALEQPLITQGLFVAQFEKDLATCTQAAYASALNSGTAALHAACYAVGVQANTEVITTPLTFAASSNAALFLGAKPVFADVDKDTFLLDPADVLRKITPQTRAIVAVDLGGHPCDYGKLKAICQQHHIALIEDASHALGSIYQGQKVGTIADLTTFSFHPVKHITTGEGGAVTTNSAEWHEKVEFFRCHCQTRDQHKLENQSEADGLWYYEIQDLGFNYRLSDINAALGVSQLQRIEANVQQRRRLMDVYRNGLAAYAPDIRVQTELPNVQSAYHLCLLQIDFTRFGVSRKEVVERLRSDFNIGTNVHYIPVYWHPLYQKLGYQRGLCPQAEAVYEQLLTVPLFPQMSEADCHYVIESLLSILKLK